MLQLSYCMMTSLCWCRDWLCAFLPEDKLYGNIQKKKLRRWASTLTRCVSFILPKVFVTRSLIYFLHSLLIPLKRECSCFHSEWVYCSSNFLFTTDKSFDGFVPACLQSNSSEFSKLFITSSRTRDSSSLFLWTKIVWCWEYLQFIASNHPIRLEKNTCLHLT